MKLNRKFYEQNTLIVAKKLLGKQIVYINNNNYLKGKIVETEAYLGKIDKACHSYKGKTKRNKVMFGPPGYTYIYLCYGIHYMFNIVTGKIEEAEAVLIRAIEPLEGISLIKNNNPKKNIKLTNGPGKWTKTFGINLKNNEKDLLSDKLYILDQPCIEESQIIKKTRIGIEYSEEWKNKLFRFYIKNNFYISVK